MNERIDLTRDQDPAPRVFHSWILPLRRHAPHVMLSRLRKFLFSSVYVPRFFCLSVGFRTLQCRFYSQAFLQSLIELNVFSECIRGCGGCVENFKLGLFWGCLSNQSVSCRRTFGQKNVSMQLAFWHELVNSPNILFIDFPRRCNAIFWHIKN